MVLTTGRRALGKRALWITADQAVSSLSNALLTIVIARAVSPVEYGAFGLAFSVYSFVVGISQALGGQTLIIRYSAESPATQRQGAATASAVAVVVGTASGAVLAAATVVLVYPVSAALAVVGLLLPALMLQDCWRTYFVSIGSPEQALVNDGVWIAVQVLGIGVVLALGATSAAPYIAAWGLAALVAGLIGVRQADVRPRFAGAWGWVRRHRDISIPTVCNSLAVLGSTQVAFFLVALVGSVDVVGALRGVQTLLGPLNIVGFALSSFAVPEIVRRQLTARGYLIAAAAISAVIVVVDVVWGAVLLLLPSEVGRELLGATWDGARSALPGMVVFTIAIGATVGATATLRALARTDLAFWTSAMLGPAILVGAVVGVRFGGAAGSAWGFAVAGAALIVPCWLFLLHAARRGPRPPKSV